MRRPQRSRRVPAVVVGNGLNALGMARSLAAGGVPVVLLAAAGDSGPAAASRHVVVHRYVDDQPNAVVAALARLAESWVDEGPRPLFLTEEEKVATVSAHRAWLGERYGLMLPEPEVIRTLLDKNGFAAAAQQAGAPVPAGLAIRDRADLAGLSRLVPPLVIKPGGRQPAYLARYPRAERVETRAEAERLLTERLAWSANMVVQEWIDGADDQVYFCLQFRPPDGRPAVSFTGCKLRAWPPTTGGTAVCRAAPEAAEPLVSMTDDFFDQVGMVGLASMEYKWRASTGDYLMIEPTIGRSDHQEEIATLNGTNLALAAYAWAADMSLPPQRSNSRPRIWRDRLADALAAEAGAPAWRPGKARVVDALWRATDPRPGLADLRSRLRRRLIGEVHA